MTKNFILGVTKYSLWQAAESILNYSDEGYIVALAIEELILLRFLDDEDMKRYSNEEAPRIFARRINNEVRAWLAKYGPDFSLVLTLWAAMHVPVSLSGG